MLKDLEALVDEYYQAQADDPRRLRLLRKQILDLARRYRAGTGCRHCRSRRRGRCAAEARCLALRSQGNADPRWAACFRRFAGGAAADGPDRGAGARRRAGAAREAEQSLQRAIAADLICALDPLDCEMAGSWAGPRPEILAGLSDALARNADTVERIEMLASKLVSGEMAVPGNWGQTGVVMDGPEPVETIDRRLRRG